MNYSIFTQGLMQCIRLILCIYVVFSSQWTMLDVSIVEQCIPRADLLMFLCEDESDLQQILTFVNQKGLSVNAALVPRLQDNELNHPYPIDHLK